LIETKIKPTYNSFTYIATHPQLSASFAIQCNAMQSSMPILKIILGIGG
jgi:hypothetical protein